LQPNDFIKYKLNDRLQHGSLRRLTTSEHLLDFCSNDYLGFAASKELKVLVDDEVKRSQGSLNGSTGSRLLAGNTAYAENLEQQIADYHNSETGLLFNSGYDANLGLLSCLPQRGDTVIHDELIHASVIDGIRLSYADRLNFKHNDLNSLKEKFIKARGRVYVVVESVYSMDGDAAPLEELVELAAEYSAHLIVDEAHAVGVFGKGLINKLNLQNKVFARVVTFGKAMGCHGAIVLGNHLLRNYLINFARSFIYTTAAPLHQLATIKMAYQHLDGSADTIKLLHENIAYYNTHINNSKLNSSAIQTVLLSSNTAAVEGAKKLRLAGFDVRAILNPTVPSGTERLRICLHSFNTKTEIHTLCHVIKNLSHTHA